MKDYERQGIVNQNPRQLATLSTEDVETISEVLQDHGDLLGFFGYTLR